MYWQKVWMVFFQSNLMACFDQDAPQYYSKKLMYCIEVHVSNIELFNLYINVFYVTCHPIGVQLLRLCSQEFKKEMWIHLVYHYRYLSHLSHGVDAI